MRVPHVLNHVNLSVPANNTRYTIEPSGPDHYGMQIDVEFLGSPFIDAAKVAFICLYIVPSCLSPHPPAIGICLPMITTVANPPAIVDALVPGIRT